MGYFGSGYFGSSYYGSLFGGDGSVGPGPVVDPVESDPCPPDIALTPSELTYSYPATDLDRPQTLLAELGDFWSTIYEDQFPERWAYQLAQLELQSSQNARETQAAASRLTVPICHTDRWRLLLLLQSDLTDDQLAVARYGEIR